MDTSKRRITIDDLNKMNWVSDPRLSPDGKRIAYVIKSVDPHDDKKYISRIWMVGTDAGEPVALTAGPKTDNNPHWSPDGHQLAFTSNRGGNNQIWLLPMSGGEARQLTHNKSGAGAPLWSPDGRKIAYLAKDEVDPSEQEDGVRIIDRLHYKQNGIGFLGHRYTQIFVVDVATGQEKQITEGCYDCNSLTWSPDSQQLAFSSNRTAEPDYNNQSDIWVVSAKGGELRQVTPGAGPCYRPSWSPCGQYIAYLGHDNTYKNATLSRVMVIPAAGGKPRNLSAEFDRAPSSNLVWNKDGQKIFFLAVDGPRSKLYQAETAGTGKVTPLTGDDMQEINGFSFNTQTNSFALAITEPTNVGDIFYMPSDAQPQRLTHHNQSWLSEIELSVPERFTIQSDGMQVEGWVMKPIGFQPQVKYPAILEIHGGPHSTYGYSFNHEFQLLCAAGYAVIYTNPPGSQGYGQEFLIQTHNDWGGTDYRAIMAAMDHVSQFDFIDTARLGITGGSYGGFMTNWIIAHDHRFQAAVTQRSTCNRYSMFGTSDVGFFNGQFEFMGNPWDNPQFYIERSPITYVNNIETPLLILHSEEDLRCPMEQAEQLYTALKWLRKKVILARFPNETHELSRSGQPRNRAKRLELLIGWFKKYIPTIAEEYTW